MTLLTAPPTLHTGDHVLPSEPISSLAEYHERGGMRGLLAALDLGPDRTIGTIAEAGIRGRGGAGFPVAAKWSSIRDLTTTRDTNAVVVNAAEGEPGTFKDRALLRANPWAVLEGALVAAVTLGADTITIATKQRFRPQIDSLRSAVDELRRDGWLDTVGVRIVEGPDQYLFGEETALLEVIEGEDPLPRNIPPYMQGLHADAARLGWSARDDVGTGTSSNPALVNNAETFAHVALVLRHGPEWYRSLGSDASPGPTIVTVSGDVAAPGVADITLGLPLGQVIDLVSGGPLPGRTVKAVLSGVSHPALPGDALDTPVDHDALAAAGGGLGSAGFIVYDDRRNMVDVAYQVSRFLHVESCGQCNACKLGTRSITEVLERLVFGERLADDAVRRLQHLLRTVTDANRCYLPVQEQVLVASLLARFPEDLEVRLAGVPGDPDVPLPRPSALVEGVLTFDDGPPFRQPDWQISETPVRLTR